MAEFYQHPSMCCFLDKLPDIAMCKNCHHLKRKFPHDPSLSVGETQRICVVCRELKTVFQMRKNTQYIDKRDNICQTCFAKTGPYKKKGKQEHSLRTVRFGMNGEERRCSEKKHWVPVAEMIENSKFADNRGVMCVNCKKSGNKRKLSKSQRKFLFGGRKIKQEELQPYLEGKKIC